MNNIIVLDLYLKLTNKSYLIHMFSYDLIQFFDHLVLAYCFLGHHVECLRHNHHIHYSLTSDHFIPRFAIHNLLWWNSDSL